MTKIDAFAHILPSAYPERLEAIASASAVSERMLDYGPRDPIFTDGMANISSPGLPDADVAAIFADNATRLLGIARGAAGRCPAGRKTAAS